MSTPAAAFTIALDAPPATPRLGYVMDVFCAWFGWRWIDGNRRSITGEPPPRSVVLRFRAGPPAGPLPGGTVDVRASTILFEGAGATGYTVEWAEVLGQVCPCGLDVLGGIFYCLSLYAEYGIEARDAHGRLPASAHPLVTRGVSHRPVADALALALATQLWHAGGKLGRPSFVQERIGLSVDVDAPAAVVGKPWLRGRLGLVRAVLRASYYQDTRGSLNLGQIKQWARGEPDPYDTFDYMADAADELALPQDYFTLVGYGTKVDPGWRQGHPRWAPFWRKLNERGRVGIHPSYHSSERPELLEAELRTLREALDRPVVISRQHFLRLRLPDTFRALLELGVREEHSLMWAETAGYRTGSSRSFAWYDLRRERSTALLLVPPHAMDVTARYYGGLSPKRAIAEWSEYARVAEVYGSGLRCIWHNSNLGPWHGWHPWREAFEASLRLADPGRTRSPSRLS